VLVHSDHKIVCLVESLGCKRDVTTSFVGLKKKKEKRKYTSKHEILRTSHQMRRQLMDE
jgi:hypothetical protein